jgi:hypothetical protein
MKNKKLNMKIEEYLRKYYNKNREEINRINTKNSKINIIIDKSGN